MGTEKRRSQTLTTRSSHVDGWRDWASLSQDMVGIVLRQLSQTDILCGAGLVFPSWRRLAVEEPLFWRRIDLREPGLWRWHEPPHAGWKAMARAAVDASAGQCESFRGHVDADVLVHLSNSAPLLRSLCVTGWPHTLDGKLITEIIKKLPLLERVVLRGSKFQEELLVALLDHCPRLELLDASQSWPMFGVWQEPIATRIRDRSNIKDLLLPRG